MKNKLTRSLTFRLTEENYQKLRLISYYEYKSMAVILNEEIEKLPYKVDKKILPVGRQVKEIK